ncbi:MAG TPA: DUF2516 family protein [Candidatus Lustribacter sp.]|nr:DUF2516 family protein [Candidatus Lustribacter sp.]
MPVIWDLQNLLLTLLGLAAFGAELFALIDAVRHQDNAYVAAGKRTRTFWLVVLAVAVVVGFVTMGNILASFIGVIAFVAAAVYLADVRPALRQVTGGGGRNQGPYGPW